jgi:hypothetical protein
MSTVMESTMATPTIEAVAERLDGLERENRRLRWVAAGMFVAAAVLATETHFSKAPRVRGVQEVEKLVIRDKEGRLRASFGLDETGLPGLKMYDSRGLEQITLGTPSDMSSSLAFFDKGHNRLTLDSSIDGSSALRFFDKGEKSSSVLFMGPDGSTGLTFDMGKQSLAMGVQPNGDSALFTTDAEGREIGRVGADSVDARTLGLVRGEVVTKAPESAALRRRSSSGPEGSWNLNLQLVEPLLRNRELVPVDPTERCTSRGAAN